MTCRRRPDSILISSMLWHTKRNRSDLQTRVPAAIGPRDLAHRKSLSAMAQNSDDPAANSTGCFDLAGRPRLSHVRGSVIVLALTDLAVHSVKASALFDLLAPPLGMASFSVMLPQL